MSGEPRAVVNCLDVVLKIAERCNLACPYCYYFFQENDLYKSSPALISEDTIRDVAKFLRRGAQELNIQQLFIGLHGGEPLLMPKKRFAALCRILREELSDVTKVKLAMQTNGTRIDKEWVSILGEHQVSAGVSLDGPPHIHNAARPDHKGKGSYDATVRGLRMLQEGVRAGTNRATGILCVANPNYSGEEVVKHLVEDLGIDNFNILLPRDGYDSEIWKPQSKWITYFTEILRYWQATPKTYGRLITIQLFNDILRGMTSEPNARVMDMRRAVRHHIITISGDGKFGMDDNIMALDKALFDANTNVRNTTLAQFIASPRWQQLVQAVDKAPEKCASCEWYRSCRSGDLFNRYKKGSGFDQPSVFCETLDTIHTTIAALVARRENGVERLTQLLSQKPEYWAREFMQPVILGPAPADIAAPEANSIQLPVVE